MGKRAIDLSKAIEFLPNKFYYLSIRDTKSFAKSCGAYNIIKGKDINNATVPSHVYIPAKTGHIFICLNDHDTVKKLNACENSNVRISVADTVRFNEYLTTIHHENPSESRRKWYFYLTYTNPSTSLESQIVQLICRWRLIKLSLSPETSVAPFQHLQFHASAFDLYSSLTGLHKGLLHPQMERQLDLSIEDDINDYQQVVWLSKRFVVIEFESGTPPNELQSPGQQGNALIDINQAESLIEWIQDHNISRIFQLSRQPEHLNLETLLDKNNIKHYDLTADRSKVQNSTSNACSRESIDFEQMIPSWIQGALITAFLNAYEESWSPTTMNRETIAILLSSAKEFMPAAVCVGSYLMKHQQYTYTEASSWLHFVCSDRYDQLMESNLKYLQSIMWESGKVFRNTRVNGRTTRPLDKINLGKVSLEKESLLGTKDRGNEKNQQYPSLTQLGPATLRSISTSTSVSTSSARKAVVRCRQLPKATSSHSALPELNGSQLLQQNSEKIVSCEIDISTRRSTDYSRIHRFVHFSTTHSTSRANTPPPEKSVG